MEEPLDRSTYPDTRLGSFSIRESHARDSIRFLVEEDNICDFAEFGAFIADVFLDFEDGGGIFLVKQADFVRSRDMH